MITLRPATLQDLEIVTYWDTLPHVIDSDPDDEWDWEFELSRQPFWRSQWMAEWENEPIGFIQIIDPQEEESHYWGDIGPNKRAIDIWIGEEKNLNKGYGTAMMKLAIALCFQEPEVTEIWIDPLKSNTKAHRFYEKMGFEFLEEKEFNGQACYVYRLKRKIET